MKIGSRILDRDTTRSSPRLEPFACSVVPMSSSRHWGRSSDELSLLEVPMPDLKIGLSEDSDKIAETAASIRM